MCSNKSSPRIMVFRPTWSEFQNFSSYIDLMESQGAHKAGVAKVIPPPEWIPRKKSYDEDDIMSLKIPTPMSQVVEGKQGLYQQINVVKKPMTVAQYKIIAESNAYKTPNHFDYSDLERKYWNSITYKSPLYGADVPGSITDKDVKGWNINQLGTILDYLNEDDGITIEGINTSFTYFGMWKTSFPWHIEDMDLYGMYYLHEGHPKTWYTIPPEHGHRFERLVNNLFPDYASMCPAFLRHKITLISPYMLKQHSIPFNKITQERGEFMITFPFGYHSGFDHGFNITESINFASERWVEYGKRVSLCHCYPNSVKFSLDTFVKRVQPEKYELWLEGKDIGGHPEHSSRTLAAHLPKKSDILCIKNNTDIPKCFNAAGRKHAETHNLSDSESPNKIHENKVIDVPSSTSVQGLDEKDKGEQISEAQGELVEDKKIWLNADEEMGVKNSITDMVNNRCSFEIEKLYNVFRSKNDPYCSLCMMFSFSKVPFNLDWQTKARSFMHPELPKLQKSTKALFKHALSGSYGVSTDDLIRCKNCYLTVHKICYGIIVDTSRHNWLCDRCEKNPLSVVCAYCPLRGGALKEFKVNVWSHVECHLLVHGSIPLNINTFSTEFLTNQKCVICNLTCGNCFRCSEDSCDACFHISCGIFAGYDYLYDQNNKHIITIKCDNHFYTLHEQRRIHINQKVWAKHFQHKRISECKIINIDETLLGIVEFGDGTISDSITLNEIKDYENELIPINNEIHLESGEKGVFLGFTYEPIYTVEFNDGTSCCLRAHQIYSDNVHKINHLKLQAKRGLSEYEKEKKSVYDVIF